MKDDEPRGGRKEVRRRSDIFRHTKDAMKGEEGIEREESSAQADGRVNAAGAIHC